MKKLIILSLLSTVIFATDHELSESEKEAIQSLANSQIPHITYTPIKKSDKDAQKTTDTSGVAIHSADKSITVEVSVKKETDANGKETETGSVSVRKSFD